MADTITLWDLYLQVKNFQLKNPADFMMLVLKDFPNNLSWKIWNICLLYGIILLALSLPIFLSAISLFPDMSTVEE